MNALDALIRSRLATAQARLAQLDGVELEPGPGAHGRDLADAAQAGQDREARITDRERAREEIRALTDALGRVADGTFGRCADCGDWIALARLRALPLAVTCLECQAARERAVHAAGDEGPYDLPEMRGADDAR
ncbi:MAG TPA: TraR/DksA family transcriptional regulator [Methylomirabilota bacterium]|nr:TraR/DksA family transcriptional regulator [Methylomirabilota bacterium]